MRTTIYRAVCAAYILLSPQLQAAEPRQVSVLFLEQLLPPKPVLSNIREYPKDAGISGAMLAITDSNTTGKFLGNHYALTHIADADTAKLIATASRWVNEESPFIITKLPATSLLHLASQPDIAGHALIINASSPDDSLRTTACQLHLLHTIPSRAMLADALAQFLIKKRWNQWLLLRGTQPEDQQFAAALQRAAKRFGGKIVDNRSWAEKSDLRRTAQSEMPLFTQAKNYDITLVADEAGDVGEYIPYNTWLPRPVAGTQGLTPVAWHWTIEQWGGAQLQNRFYRQTQRTMNAEDYAAWVAVRSISEAVTKTQSTELTIIYQYMMSDQFQLSAFKGRPLSFRPWNGQIRQPIPLVQPNAVVSQSPQEGYLHPTSELDTLGFDRTEVACTMEPTK